MAAQLLDARTPDDDHHRQAKQRGVHKDRETAYPGEEWRAVLTDPKKGDTKLKED
jgi:hypothetical protein